jgi:hypothetical protein
LLEGKSVNLRVMEKEDLPLLAEWANKPEYFGEYNPLRQISKAEIENDFVCVLCLLNEKEKDMDFPCVNSNLIFSRHNV